VAGDEPVLGEALKDLRGQAEGLGAKWSNLYAGARISIPSRFIFGPRTLLESEG
jgi:hypothetical protein